MAGGRGRRRGEGKALFLALAALVALEMLQAFNAIGENLSRAAPLALAQEMAATG